MKRFIFKRPDGKITVFIGMPGVPDEKVKTHALRALPKGTVFVREIDEAELPSGRTFRSQWRDDGQGVIVDMPLAREAKMAAIRAKRNKLLVESDGKMMGAQEKGDAAKANTLKTKRQQLRDIPQNVDLDAIATPEALEAFEPTWPSI
jgi:hypothetical protein